MDRANERWSGVRRYVIANPVYKSVSIFPSFVRVIASTELQIGVGPIEARSDVLARQLTFSFSAPSTEYFPSSVVALTLKQKWIQE